MEDCALFIPADTSVSVIHLGKGISQTPTPPHTHTRDKHDRERRHQAKKGTWVRAREKIFEGVWVQL